MRNTVDVRPRRLLLALLVVAALALTACTTTVAGSGRLKLPETTGVTDAQGLATLLMSPPENSEPVDTTWAKKKTPSLRDLAEQTYKDADRGEQTLEDYGIKGVAHVVWDTSGPGADMTLLLFDTASKADNWKDEEVAAFGTEGLEKRTLDAGDDTIGFSFDENSNGVTDTRFHTVVDNIGVLFDYFTTDSYDDTDAKTWLTTQVKRLGG